MPKQNKALSPDQIAKEITNTVKKDIRKYIYYCLTAIVLVFGGGLLKVYTDAISSIEKLLIEQVSKEFEQPRIKATVEKVAANEGKRLLQEQIKPEVAQLKIEMEASIAETTKLIQSAQAKLNDWTTLLETEDSARCGSRKAFLKILEFGERSDSLGKMAKPRAEILIKDLLIYRSVQPSLATLERITTDGKKEGADKLSTSELFNELEHPGLPKEQIMPMMNHIGKKPKKEILYNAKRILQSSDSLVACVATCGILNKMLGNRAFFIDFDSWLKICEEELSKEK